MKTLIAVLVAVFMCTVSFAAYVPGISILTAAQIEQLSDDELLATYIEASIEIEAMRAFYAPSGFTQDQSKTFKDWLRYRVALLAEINKRGLTVPQIQ